MAKPREGPEMLFKCLPTGAQIPGRFPGPVHERGKWFTIDIHCHVLTPKAAEMVAGRDGHERISGRDPHRLGGAAIER